MFEGFKMVAVQEVTVTGPVKFKGSNRIAYNYDLNGKPFGQIYTYKTAGEKHYWYASKADGSPIGGSGTFHNRNIADIALRSEM